MFVDTMRSEEANRARAFFIQRGGGGGAPHIKGLGMLVVFLRGVNFGFWSHLRCSGQNAIIFSYEDLVYGCTSQKYKNICIVCVFGNIVSFRGQKSLGYARMGLL